MNAPAPTSIEELREYSEQLKSYTTADLEDIYFHIHLLRHPLRYRLVRMELERRGLAPVSTESASLPDMDSALCKYKLFSRATWLRRSILLFVTLISSTLATFGLLLPIYIFAIPLHFQGIQTAIAYSLIAPISLVSGGAAGMRVGGNRAPVLAAVGGVVIGAWLFWQTGTPHVILESLEKSGGGVGFSFGM